MRRSHSDGLIPSRKVRRELRYALTAIAAGVLVLAAVVYGLKVYRDAQLRQLACLLVQHVHPGEPTGDDIRAQYECPAYRTPTPTPTPSTTRPAKTPGTTPAGRSSTTPAGQAPARTSTAPERQKRSEGRAAQSRPRRASSPHAGPSQAHRSTPSSPSSPSSPGPVLVPAPPSPVCAVLPLLCG